MLREEGAKRGEGAERGRGSTSFVVLLFSCWPWLLNFSLRYKHVFHLAFAREISERKGERKRE